MRFGLIIAQVVQWFPKQRGTGHDAAGKSEVYFVF